MTISALLVARLVLSLLVAAGVLVAGVRLHRILPVEASLSLYVLPVSIVIGFLPLLHWYRRDSYPIGLVYFPVSLYWLIRLGRLLGIE